MVTYTVSHSEEVSYLPKPNTAEIILTCDLAPIELTCTAFVIPVFADQSILLACHQRRGLECPGGHIEPGETYEQAARREALEEVGCIVSDIIPIGFIRLTTHGVIPEGYRYPHPVSYQQFFAGKVLHQNYYESNEECAAPARLYQNDFDILERQSVPIFAKEALRIFN